MAEKIKEGDFIQIEYIGKVKGTGKIFDLTSEDLAKKEGIYDKDTKYGPITIVVGAGHVLKGLDNALVGAEVGKKLNVTILPKDGFGERNPSLVKLVPRSVFKRERINPMPGLPIRIQNNQGVVQSVSGGRIKVDFNHPLAGKELDYEVEILKKITDTKEKIKSLFEFHLARADLTGLDIKINGKEAEIKSPSDEKTRRFINLTKDILATDILKYIKELDKVRFVDEFVREKQTSTKSENKTSK